MNLDMPRDQFYDEVQQLVQKFPTGRQEELKSLVDWLEDYEKGELKKPSE